MRPRVSTKGQVVLPAPLRRLGIRAGDPLEINIEQGRIVVSQPAPPVYDARIVQDPLCGFTVIDLGPDAPVLAGEKVRDLLVGMKGDTIRSLIFLSDGVDISSNPDCAASPAQVTDGHLLRLASDHGVVFATLDGQNQGFLLIPK